MEAKDNWVFISADVSYCEWCKSKTENFIFISSDKKTICMKCAGLSELVFLPSGDAAMSRRAKKHSMKSALVLKWSMSRRRYERQGILVTADAITHATNECTLDLEKRVKRQEKELLKRMVIDQNYIKEFAGRIRLQYPNVPKGVEIKIADHACQKYSGRVGRTLAAKNFDSEMIKLAVTAYIRHSKTNYEDLFTKGYTKSEARAEVRHSIDLVLARWRE